MSIHGLIYKESAITQEELLDFLKLQTLVPVSRFPNSRMVIHYGYNYSYTNKALKPLDRAEPIPPLFLKLLEHKEIKKRIANPKEYFNQCIVNRYIKNEVIGAHTDHQKFFGEYIVCFTINNGCTMRFKHNGETVDVKVEPESMYIMFGDARWKWTHEIPKISANFFGDKPRYSITFRHVVEQYQN